MLSLQGIICKELQKQGKLEEKFKDLALETKSPPWTVFYGYDGGVTGILSGEKYYSVGYADGSFVDWVNVPWELSIAPKFLKQNDAPWASVNEIRMMHTGGGYVCVKLTGQYADKDGSSSSYRQDLYNWNNMVGRYGYGRIIWDPETKIAKFQAKRGDDGNGGADYWRTLSVNPGEFYSVNIRVASQTYSILDTDHICLKYDGKIVYGADPDTV